MYINNKMIKQLKKLWDENEDEILINKVEEYGKDWNKIAKEFNNRDINELKSRYYLLESFTNKIINIWEKEKRKNYENCYDNKIINKNKMRKIDNNEINYKYDDYSDIHNYPNKILYY